MNIHIYVQLITSKKGTFFCKYSNKFYFSRKARTTVHRSEVIGNMDIVSEDVRL